MAVDNMKVKRGKAVDAITADYAGKKLVVWFVGSWAPRKTLAKMYRNEGFFSMDADYVVVTDSAGKELIRRHYSKLACVQEGSTLLFGKFCQVCNEPVPMSYGNCPICTHHYRTGLLFP